MDTDGTDDAEAVRRRLQILAAEHWSLLTARSQLWNEALSRGAMYLAVVSGSVVALALVAQATHFGSEFTTAALLLLPVVLFVGLSTFVRVVHSNVEDRHWVRAMNRVRHAYLEIAPELAPYFTTSPYDDEAGLLVSYGTLPGRRGRVQGLLNTSGVVAVVDGVVAGVVASLALSGAGLDQVAAVCGGVLAFVALEAALAVYHHRTTERVIAADPPRFPTPRSG